MPLKDHFEVVTRLPCHIITVDPATKIVNGVTKGGPIRISSYTGGALSRWPKPGEEWIVKRENGSWYLDTILPNSNDVLQSADLEPGDVRINAPNNGRIYLSTGHTVARKYKQTVGNATKTKWIVTHELDDVSLHVSANLTHTPFTPITAFTFVYLNPNQIEVTFVSAPSIEGAQVVVIG